MQVCRWALARGLHVKLERRAMALGSALPVAFLAPWRFGGDLLVPTGTLDRVLPGLHADAAHTTHLLMSDATYQFLPWELEVRHAMKRLRLPLWSDRLDGGSSPWINPLLGVLSPLAMLARLAPIQHFLLVALALKMLVAGEGTWLLARRLGRSRVASLLAAASFTLGGGVMSWALFPHTAAVAWVPWLTLGAIVTGRRPTARAVATIALITAALLLAGHPGDGACRRALRGALRSPCAAAAAVSSAAWPAPASRRSSAAASRWRAAARAVPARRAGLAAGARHARGRHAAAAPSLASCGRRAGSWRSPRPSCARRSARAPMACSYGGHFEGPFDWVDALSGLCRPGGVRRRPGRRPGAARPALLAFLRLRGGGALSWWPASGPSPG